jgi:hypothetical protein
VLLQSGVDDASDFVVIFNPTPEEVIFSLPEPSGGESWFVIVDTASGASPDDVTPEEPTGAIAVVSHTTVVAGRQR